MHSTIMKKRIVEQMFNYIKTRIICFMEADMKKVFLLDGLCCANCAAKIERGIAKLDGVQSASVSFLTTKLTIEFDDDKEDKIIEEAIKIVRKILQNVNLFYYMYLLFLIFMVK